MINNELSAIPRVASSAPNKNTIEWKIPGKVEVSFLVIERIGFTFIAKIYIEKKHWWSSSEKTFMASGQDVMGVVSKISAFLNNYGYYIDPDTIKFREVIGK